MGIFIRWSDADDEKLRQALAAGNDFAAAAKLVGRSEDGVACRASRLGIVHANSRPKWTPAEDDVLRATLTQGGTFAEASKAVGKGLSACKKRATRLGIKSAHKPGWSYAQALQHKADVSAKIDQKRAWSEEDDEKLRALIAKGASFKQAAAALGRSRSSIAGRVDRLGIESMNAPCITPGFRRKSRAALPSPAQLSLDLPGSDVADTFPIGDTLDELFDGATPIEGTQEKQGYILLELGSRQCRGVVAGTDEEGRTLFCGAPVPVGVPFCATCRARYFVTPRPRAVKQNSAVPAHKRIAAR
jgi:hypothetical protein